MAHYSPESVITVMLFTFTFLVGVPGNMLVIWVTSLKMKRTVNTVWFLNLALADITCCLSIPLSIALELIHHHWPYGPFLCKVLPSIIILNMFASVFTLVAISMDRCLLVVKPVWAQNHRNVRSAWIICLVIWFCSSLMCLPVPLYRQTLTRDNITTCEYKYSSEMEYYDDTNYDYKTNLDAVTEALTSSSNTTNLETLTSGDKGNGNYPEKYDEGGHDFPSDFGLTNGDSYHEATITISRALFGFFVPAVVISACYMRLAWKMKGATFNRMSRKTLKVVFGIVLAFYLSWTPYHIVGLVMLYVNNPSLNHLDHLSQALAYSNSCVNPILYVFMGKDFKSKMRKSVLKLIESAFSEEATKTTSQSRSKVSMQEIPTISGQDQLSEHL
uniref:Complement C3a receptor 1 n=1 Tax=Leptobrachium leishanense TaxID=445787 RepID=A0A8C5QYF6_9ANUR